MATKIDAGKCIELFIKYKNLMFTLIDEMDQSEANYGVNLHLYTSECRKLIKLLEKSDSAEAKRLSYAFDITNLQHNGLIVGVDKNHSSNKITFQTFFIDLFRHLDNKRVKSLSNSDYETIRIDFLALLEKFKTIPLSNDNAEFTETYETLTQKLTDTLVLIKRNTDSLDGSAKRLSEFIDKVDNNSFNANSNPAIQKLEELANLYERKVIPSIEFLNPNQLIEGNNTFVRIIREIEDLFADKFPKLATYIQYRHTAISSYHKDIKEIQRTLLSYYKRHKRSRDVFNALENVFNNLKKETYQLHDGKMIHNQIPLSDLNSVIIKGNLVKGLKSFSNSFSSKIAWNNEYAVVDLKELVRVHKEKLNQDVSEPKQSSKVKNDDLKNKRLKKQRQLKIIELINGLDTNLAYFDVFDSIHSLLATSIDNYELIDAIHGYRNFIAKEKVKNRLIQSQDKKIVKLSGYKHQYWRRSLQENKAG